jgi:hypothetical protein
LNQIKPTETLARRLVTMPCRFLALGDSKVEIRTARGCCELRIRRFGV